MGRSTFFAVVGVFAALGMGAAALQPGSFASDSSEKPVSAGNQPMDLPVPVEGCLPNSRFDGSSNFAPILPIAPPAESGGGACCFVDLTCQNLSNAAECGNMGGVFLPGADCADNPCEPGACCSETTCITADAFSCIIAGRDFIGAGTSCDDDPCEIGVGACCIGSDCVILAEDDCLNDGGIFLGPGTNCVLGPCDDGACCLPPEDTCREMMRFECDKLGGVFVEGTGCDESPCVKPSECPENSLFGQSRDDPDDDWLALTSEASAGLQRYDDYTGVAGPVDELVWWGLDLEFVDGMFVECTESDPTFEISFHLDAGGQPGAAVCSYTVTATRTPTGLFYNGTELNEYTATLPEPCVLVNGWVSIVGLGDPDCLFLWMSAGLGLSWCDGCIVQQESYDIGFCLLGEEGGVFGACCDDQTGICTDDVEIVDCAEPGLRFVPNTDCADLDPPCGVVLGACCFEETATCEITEEKDCANMKGNWLGGNTTCEQCPCVVLCPDGASIEDEPVCFDGYIDQTNGGCAAEDQLFEPIELGDVVCGTSGVFEIGGKTFGDFDWYELQLTEATEVSWSATAEFRPQVLIYDGSGGCPGEFLIGFADFECDPVTATAELQPGVYWLVIGPFAATDTAVCGASYTAQVTGVPICVADIAQDDDEVNTSDLLTLLANWGVDGPGAAIAAPFDVVDTADLLALLASWGPCP